MPRSAAFLAAKALHLDDVLSALSATAEIDQRLGVAGNDALGQPVGRVIGQHAARGFGPS
jgi:hypothetical protein